MTILERLQPKNMVVLTNQFLQCTDTVTHKGISLRQALRHALELDAHATSDNDMCFRKNVVYEITCDVTIGSTIR